MRMLWSRLPGQDDPLPEGVTARGMDNGRRIGIVLRYLLYRNRITGIEHVPPSGPLVVVANHTAFVDGAVIFGVLPRRVSFLVKSASMTGALGWLLRTSGQHSVQRGPGDRRVLLAALEQVRSGGGVGIFPEGTRGDGDVKKVFHGAGWLAARSGATVLPIAIRGTRRPGRYRRLLPYADVAIGRPFAVTPGAGRSAVTAASETIRTKLAALVASLDEEIRCGQRRKGIR